MFILIPRESEFLEYIVKDEAAPELSDKVTLPDWLAVSALVAGNEWHPCQVDHSFVD